MSQAEGQADGQGDGQADGQRRGRRLVVVANVYASFGSTARFVDAAIDGLRDAGHEVEVIRGAAWREVERRAAAAAQTRPDALVAIGGDGTMNLVANAVAGTGVPFALIATGTGNDFARTMGIPHKDAAGGIRAALDALERPPRAIDAGRASWREGAAGAGGEERSRLFAAALSAGFDAIVNERANRMRRPKGAARYIIAMLIELVRLKPIAYRILIDGEEVVSDGLLVTVGNGRSIGGGMMIVPEAEPDDGRFDVAVVEPFGRIGFLRLFPKVYQGRHVGDRRVHISRASRVRIEADGVVAYADGERFGPLPVAVEIVPRALLVHV